jgi:hypothetical protein
MCEIHGVYVSPPCGGFHRPGKKARAEGQSPVETAIDFLKTLTPAVAQSLKDIEIHVSPPFESFSNKAKPKSEEHVQEVYHPAPAVVSKPDSGEEVNETEQKSGSSHSKDGSFFSDADGNSIAEVIGRT